MLTQSAIELHNRYYGLFTFAGTDSDLDSNPIPVLDSWDGNLTLTLCSVRKSFACYNVAIWFAVRIGIGIGIRIQQCKSAIRILIEHQSYKVTLILCFLFS